VSGEPDSVGIAIDLERCVGIGACLELEPAAVEFDDEGFSQPRSGVLLPRERALVLRRSCPSAAISIVEPSRDEQ
jgi:ferredoxin